MARPSNNPKSTGKRLATLLRSLSRRKGKTVVEQGDTMSLLLLPDSVLEHVLLQAHPLAALTLGATCKHLHTELARHQRDICKKFMLQPENQVQITAHNETKSRSFVPQTPTLGTYATQGSFTYQLVVRNHWSVRGAEVLLHMLLTKQFDPDEVWTALLPAPAQEKQMYSDCIQNCVGSAGMDVNRIWDVHVAIRIPVKLSKAFCFNLLTGTGYSDPIKGFIAHHAYCDQADCSLKYVFDSEVCSGHCCCHTVICTSLVLASRSLYNAINKKGRCCV